MNDLRALLIRLAKAEFPFVVVGGYAAYAHGVTLVTQDVDVCCEFTEESLEKLWNAIGDLHPVHRMRPDRLPLDLQPGFSKDLQNLYLDTDWGQLDMLDFVAGVGGYKEALQNAVRVFIDDQIICLLSLPAVIRAKEAMSRNRDHEAVRQLRFIQEQTRGQHE